MPSHSARFFHYCIISITTGALDYGSALWLLHHHFPLYFALAFPMAFTAAISYFWLQKSGFSPTNSFSWRRLAGNIAVEVIVYFLRLTVMTIWHRFVENKLWENATGMMLAYGLGFALGYCLRRFVLFAHNKKAANAENFDETAIGDDLTN